MLCSYYEQCLNKHECAGSLCMTTLISLANYPGMVQLDSVVVLFTVSQETSILISIMVHKFTLLAAAYKTYRCPIH